MEVKLILQGFAKNMQEKIRKNFENLVFERIYKADELEKTKMEGRAT